MRYHHRLARRPAAAEPTAAAPVTAEYQAPTVGLEDKVFTIGSALYAAKFETVKEKLGKHFATQSWSEGEDAAAAFETLTQPVYDEPEEPDIPERYIAADGGKSEEDLAYEVKLMIYKMQISKYARNHDEWTKSVKNWKNNRSRMFDIVLQHCPTDLVQRIKSKDLWAETNLGKDVIALTRVIHDIAHAHDDTTQGTMAIVVSD